MHLLEHDSGELTIWWGLAVSKKGQKKRIRPQSIFFMLVQFYSSIIDQHRLGVFSEIRCVYKQNKHHQMSLLHISFFVCGSKWPVWGRCIINSRLSIWYSAVNEGRNSTASSGEPILFSGPGVVHFTDCWEHGEQLGWGSWGAAPGTAVAPLFWSKYDCVNNRHSDRTCKHIITSSLLTNCL